CFSSSAVESSCSTKKETLKRKTSRANQRMMIASPFNLKGLSPEELEILAQEIRQKIIDVMALNGGHLASNLGAVELSIALHRVFSSPQDKFIFDVSHQTYAHKILSGRSETFKTI